MFITFVKSLKNAIKESATLLSNTKIEQCNKGSCYAL